MDISIICAMTKNRVIGNHGKIPWHLPEDLKNFKAITMGKPVIMGRKTFESILQFLGKPLPGRTNIVLSKSTEFNNVSIAKDCQSALVLAAQENPSEVFIIGGGKIYKEFLPLTTKMYLSIVDEEYIGDTYFPEFNGQDWQEVSLQQKKGFLFKVLQRK
jgi:dihydrofolate reductase